MSPSSRGTAWIGYEFDQRADAYDHSEMHRWQADADDARFVLSGLDA